MRARRGKAEVDKGGGEGFGDGNGDRDGFLGVARPDGDGDGVGPLVAAPDVGDGFVGAALGVEVPGDNGACKGGVGVCGGVKTKESNGSKVVANGTVSATVCGHGGVCLFVVRRGSKGTVLGMSLRFELGLNLQGGRLLSWGCNLGSQPIISGNDTAVHHRCQVKFAASATSVQKSCFMV